MTPDICIYHGNCADGFGAAWAVWKRFEAVDYVAGVYGQEPPDVTGKNVVMVDFSYKRPILDKMAAAASTIVILDHHKTAAADLSGFPPLLDGPYNPGAIWDHRIENNAPNGVHARFDMEKSGAVLAWEYFHQGEPAPRLLLYVQDRDLWQFKLPHSREIAAYIFSRPYSFATWSNMVAMAEDTMLLRKMAEEGTAIERKHFKDINELLAITRRFMVIGGHRVPVANLPYTMSSDAAGTLAEGQPFGACYFDRNDGRRIFSLRSRDGIDVSEIAKIYGGGGHRNAAGFEAPLGWEGDQ